MAKKRTPDKYVRINPDYRGGYGPRLFGPFPTKVGDEDSKWIQSEWSSKPYDGVWVDALELSHIGFQVETSTRKPN